MGLPTGWSGGLVSGEYSDATITMALTVPANAALGNAGVVGVGINAPDNMEGSHFDSPEIVIIEAPCTCKAVVTPFPKPQTGSDYNLELSLAPGDCAGPLSNIVWTPSPNSGQGSDKATYNGLKRDTCYDFTVTGTDTDGCGADVDLSFQLPAVGVGEPPCGGRGGLGGGSGGSFGGHGFGSGGFGGTGAGGGIF
jgi:hypothetical protein